MEHSTIGGLPRHSEACLYAHWQRERGRDDLAKRLAAAAARAAAALGKGSRDEEKPTTLEGLVATDVATNLRWQAIKRANEDEAPRDELLARWKVIAETLPSNKWTAEAKDMVARYGSLIDEDAKWREPTRAELEKASPAEQVAYWIHHLRDHAARQWGQPGGVSVLGPFSGVREEKNPADQLVKLRWDAIPTLIEHITDARPTRCMGYWRDFAQDSFYLLTIGDCCASVFEAITGEEIYRRESTGGAMTKDGRARLAQKVAREWWDKVKEKGERRYLIDSVASGEPDQVGVAGRLVRNYADDALAAIETGVAHAKNEAVRAYLVSVACELEKSDPTALLEREAAADRPLMARIAATQGLVKRGHRDAIGPMIRAWDEVKDGSRELEPLLQLLLGSGDPGAVRAIARGLARRPIELRASVLGAFGGAGGSGFTFWSGVSPPVSTNPARAPESERRLAAWNEAVEDLLAASLDDEDERSGVSGSLGEQSYRDPRICDIAASAFAARWPDRCSFDMGAPLGDRDRARFRVKAAYRRARGLAAEGEWPTPAAADPARVKAALDAFGGDDAARAKASAELEAIGLGGIAAIETRIGELGSPVAGELARIASRVSCTVVAVVVSSDAGDVSEAARARLEALRGKPLTGAGFVGLITAGASGRPAEARRFRASAVRASDGSGVRIEIGFRKDPAPHHGSTTAETATSVVLGRESLTTLVGGGTLESVATAETHEAARAALDKCVAAPLRTPFVARVAISFFPEPVATKPSEPVAKSDRVDAHGDALPAGAKARYGSLRFRHADTIECLVWSPDGKTIISGSIDQTIRVWDAETGREIRRCAGHEAHVMDVAVSPDGRLIASGSNDKTMRIWDVATGSVKLVVPHPDIVDTVAFSPDGKLLASGCWDGIVRFYRPATGDCVRQVVAAKKGDRSDFRTRIAFLDADTVAVGGLDENLRLIRGDDVVVFPTTIEKIWRIACSPDKRTVACGGQGATLVLVDVKDPKKTRTLELPTEHEGGFCPIAFSPDGKMLATREPGRGVIRRWDLTTGKVLEPITGRGGGADALAFSPDGKRLAGGGWDHQVHVWDAEEGEHLSGSSGTGEFLTLVLSPDGKTLVGASRGSLVFIDAKTLASKTSVRAWTGIGLAFSPDGKHLVGGSEKRVTLWDSTGRYEHEITKGLKDYVHGVAFSPDGDTFAAADRSGVHIFSASTRKELKKIEGGRGSMSLAFSPDGKLLAVGSDGMTGTTVYDVATGEEKIATTTDEPNDICAVAFSPDGKLLASGSRGPNPSGVRLWDSSTGKLVKMIASGDEVRCVAFSPDGNLIAVGTWGVGNVVGKGLSIWSVTTGKKMVSLEGHSAYVSGVAFSKDGKTLYSASADGTVLAWDVPESK